MVNKNIRVVDRTELERVIRQEQQFQLTGDVDDKTIVSIGNIAGARAIFVGNIISAGEMRRLVLRVLDTQTGDVLGSRTEAY